MPHSFDPGILREYDVRGIVGQSLTEADAKTLGLTFGTTITRAGGKTVTCGLDGRLSSPALHAALCAGLLETGCHVTTLPVGPTPMTYFAAHHLGADAAVMVTGSHNPPEYNGFKMVLFNKPFYGAAIQDLGRMAAANDIDRAQGGTQDAADIRDAYVDRLLADFVPDRELNVVWDAGNGAAGEILMRLVARLPGRHTVLYGDIDGRFPNHHPDPTVDENLADLQACLKAERADLGIALDGDGDRIGAIDEHGGVIRCDMLLALYAAEVLKSSPGATIIGDVKCSGALFAEIDRLGGKPLMWKTGHSLVKAKMAETHSPLAGELSGHIFFADRYYGFDDALYCAIRLLNIVGAGDAPLSGHFAHLPARLGTPEIRFEVDDARKFDVARRLKDHLAELFAGENYTLTDIDGIRLDGPRGWLLVRPSNTQPAMVARIEGETPEIMDLLRERLVAALAREQLGLPGTNNH
ncbi:MAG: phosphomannomutase/phosphoglucomutase [Rhodospirillales bacterium]|nr:phosphomannomutase/phosphoglucomutase [Alphaproteobacteria bacterium]MCB9987075.1 phosphomannomutase/phosphoglucomutase [Rhodospirillales bacterium]USO08567.1 MAG: phosphomannomutase/phosphoglucomutase [Rhodospirillales bacterium]